MTIEEMKKRKKELGLSNSAIARLTGVPFGTVQKIFSGATESPRRQTIAALEKLLGDTPSGVMYHVPETQSMVQEAAPSYGKKRQGEYTVEDYYALPDDVRVELIDGEFFYMSSPSQNHQRILLELARQFSDCIDEHCEGCEMFIAPSDVQLDCDDDTMVQPDLYVICREPDPDIHAIQGAPDLTLEILSDSTRSKDMLLKTYKYKNAGVREYWIVDPKTLEILVYNFTEESLYPAKYTFDDVIPVNISEGRCSIDFRRVKARLR